jgi:hypothetical protein
MKIIFNNSTPLEQDVNTCCPNQFPTQQPGKPGLQQAEFWKGSSPEFGTELQFKGRPGKATSRHKPSLAIRATRMMPLLTELDNLFGCGFGAVFALGN